MTVIKRLPSAALVVLLLLAAPNAWAQAVGGAEKALAIEGESPVDVKAGEVVSLKGGARHTFKNTGTVTATIVEGLGKAAK